jgi:hypothetical protein
MRNLLPVNQKDVKKGEKILDEFEFSPVAMRGALLGLLHFFDYRARYIRGYNTAISDLKLFKTALLPGPL